MKKIILFFLFTAVFFPNINFGCSCVLPEFFCERIVDSDGNVYPGILLVRGQTISRSSAGMEVKIIESIYGEEVNQSKINLQHSFCTLFFNDLEEKKEYILAISKSGDKFHALSCSIFFLEIVDDVVIGKIAPGVNAIAYENFGDLEACGNAFELFALEKNILIYPNPTSEEIKIKNTSSQQILEDLELRIFDIAGRLLQVHQKAEGILPEEIWEINLQNFSSGVYLFQLSNKNRKRSFRIIKQES